MAELPVPMIGGEVRRASLIDWLSLSRKTESDEEIRSLIEAIKSVVRDHFGYGDTIPMKSAGNFGEGAKFEKVGGDIKWTTQTQAALNDWNDEGRCVGWLNFTLRGSSGIGLLPLPKAVSLITSLRDLGLDQCRRIDLTLDLYNDWDLSIFDIKEHLTQGSWRIPRRDPKCFRYMGALIPRDDGPTAATLYLASKTSENQLTLYDKGAQKELEMAWLRFELRSTRSHAEALFQKLLAAADAAHETGNALLYLDSFVTSAVRDSCDIRDVQDFPEYPNLPKNWTRSPMARLPDALAPVFRQVAPLQVRDMKISGGFAAQVRHACHSTGKTVWKLCVISVANKQDPGIVALQLGFTHWNRLTEEDFVEMAQSSGIAAKELEAAELSALNQVAAVEGIDAEVVSSHRTELRSKVERSLVGQK